MVKVVHMISIRHIAIAFIALFFLNACGDSPPKNLDTLGQDIPLKEGWILAQPADLAAGLNQDLPPNTIVVLRANSVELVDGREVVPFHLLVPFAGNADQETLNAIAAENKLNAARRADEAIRLGLNAIPRDPISQIYLPRDEGEQEKVAEYQELTKQLGEKPLPSHFYGEQALTWVPFTWPGRAQERAVYTETTQQAVAIADLLEDIKTAQ